MPLTPDERREIEKIKQKASLGADAHEYLFDHPYPGRPSRAEQVDDLLTNRTIMRRIGRVGVRLAAGITTIVVAVEAIKRVVPWLTH